MEKTIKVIDDARGIVQITTPDERFYTIMAQDEKTGNPEYSYLPSITWITSYWPKGDGFKRYLQNHTADEAESILTTAGARGSRIHEAIESFIAGEEIRHDAKFPDSNGIESELTADEYRAIVKFAAWDALMKPEYLASEKTVISRKYGYAGTLDAIAKIGDEYWLIDWKTGKGVYTSYYLQVAALRQAAIEEGLLPTGVPVKTAILQVGMPTKIGWKWTEVPEMTKQGKPYFDLFRIAKAIWESETGEAGPRQIDLPLSVKMGRIKEKIGKPAGRTAKKESIKK